MNGVCEPFKLVSPVESRSLYMKPCNCRAGSTKVLLDRILDKNLKKISELRSSMNIIETIFELENYQPSKWQRLYVDQLLIFRKASLYRIDEVDESLPEDKLYSQIKESPRFASESCVDTAKKIDQFYSDKAFEIDIPYVGAKNCAVQNDFIFDGDSDEEMGPPPKWALKSGVSPSLKHIRKNAITGIQDLLDNKYESLFTQFYGGNLLHDDEGSKPGEQYLGSVSEKNMPQISSKRRERMERRSLKKIS